MPEIFLRNDVAKVDFLSFRHPLVEGAERTAANHECHCLSRCRVDNRLLLKIWHLATLGFAVGVRHVVANEGAFARNCADLCHKEENKNGNSLADFDFFGKYIWGILENEAPETMVGLGRRLQPAGRTPFPE